MPELPFALPAGHELIRRAAGCGPVLVGEYRHLVGEGALWHRPAGEDGPGWDVVELPPVTLPKPKADKPAAAATVPPAAQTAARPPTATEPQPTKEVSDGSSV